MYTRVRCIVDCSTHTSTWLIHVCHVDIMSYVCHVCNVCVHTFSYTIHLLVYAYTVPHETSHILDITCMYVCRYVHVHDHIICGHMYIHNQSPQKHKCSRRFNRDLWIRTVAGSQQHCNTTTTNNTNSIRTRSS